MHNVTQPYSRIYKFGMILGSIAFGIPLIGYAINGLFMRYNGDDYCYASVLTKMGFWKAQWISYLQPQPYNGNRYSLTLLSDLSSLIGPLMNGVLPVLVIVVWLVGMMFVIRQVIRLTGISLSKFETLILAELLVFFTLYMAPSLPQILYWRSGMLPYLAPLVVNTFLLGIIIKQLQRNKVDILGAALIGFLALLAGGFSEAAAGFQLGYLTLLFIGILFVSPNQVKWKRTALQSLGIAWIFSISALLLLAFSPSNEVYLLKSTRPDALAFITLSINSAISFMHESITSLPLPTAILFFLSIGMSWVVFSHQAVQLRFSPLRWVKGVLMVSLSCIVLCICITAPSAYIQSAYPEFRTLTLARFVMNLAIAAIGGMSGLLIAQGTYAWRNKLELLHLGVYVVIGALCLYPIYASRNVYSTIPTYQRWASFWDERNSEIRQASQNKLVDVEVMKIDHIIPYVADLTEDPTFWYNACAAGYYGVGTIRADLPGWDSP